MNEQLNGISLPLPLPSGAPYLCDNTRIVPTGLCSLSRDSPYQKDDVTCLGEAAGSKRVGRSFLETFKNPVFPIKLLTANDLVWY